MQRSGRRDFDLSAASCRSFMIPIPIISDFIHYLVVNSGDFIRALLPWAAIAAGTSLIFLIAGAILNSIIEHLQWNLDKDDMLADRRVFQELLGSQKGAMAYERYRIYSDMSKGMQKFIMPRDMPSGVSANEILTQKTITDSDAQSLKGNTFIPGTGWVQQA